jgi:hypothetical protein
MGVSMRATTSEKNTATAAVQPNWMKNMPTVPPMKAVGRNTAISAKVVAMTARPISSAASSAALIGLLAHQQVALDILDLDDGVVHQDTDNQ